MTSSSQGSVLIVDDDPQGVKYLAEMVRSMGYAVITAEDGEDALKQLGTETIDAIVTDR